VILPDRSHGEQPADVRPDTPVGFEPAVLAPTGPQAETPSRPASASSRRRERYVAEPGMEQPEFLRRPVRRVKREAAGNGGDAGDGAVANGAAAGTRSSEAQASGHAASSEVIVDQAPARAPRDSAE
jgi:hypothetical protein